VVRAGFVHPVAGGAASRPPSCALPSAAASLLCLACGVDLCLACGAVLSLACGSATASASTASGGQRDGAPIARVSFTSRGRRSLQLGDRVAIFDRVAFASPSAIIYDAERDLYWVSNLNGESPSGRGFISRLEPDADRSTLNYIDGQRQGVPLDAPRGLAVFGDTLYVADLKTIRRFKATSGESLGDIAVPGAVFLSDVAVAVDGSVYVTDFGRDPSDAEDASADAIYQISPAGQVSIVAKRPNLGGPYALVANETGLWITCSKSNELMLLVPGADGEAIADAGRLVLPGSAPRGIVGMPDGTFLISSETAGAVYRGYRDGPFQTVIDDLEGPADLGYDTRRQRLLIPLLTGHALAIFELSPIRPAPAQ
jgi:sugar lactone lactonase YvrE